MHAPLVTYWKRKLPDKLMSHYLNCVINVLFSMFACKTFTRLAEQVLAANKRDLDLLRISINDEINLAALEEEEGLCESTGDDQGKICWC